MIWFFSAFIFEDFFSHFASHDVCATHTHTHTANGAVHKRRRKSNINLCDLCPCTMSNEYARRPYIYIYIFGSVKITFNQSHLWKPNRHTRLHSPVTNSFVLCTDSFKRKKRNWMNSFEYFSHVFSLALAPTLWLVCVCVCLNRQRVLFVALTACIWIMASNW